MKRIGSPTSTLTLLDLGNSQYLVQLFIPCIKLYYRYSIDKAL
jgi:hypothetical protein